MPGRSAPGLEDAHEHAVLRLSPSISGELRVAVLVCEHGVRGLRRCSPALVPAAEHLGRKEDPAVDDEEGDARRGSPKSDLSGSWRSSPMTPAGTVPTTSMIASR